MSVSWAFYDLRQKIQEYKAALNGSIVICG